jgi:hypothetical protein
MLIQQMRYSKLNICNSFSCYSISAKPKKFRICWPLHKRLETRNKCQWTILMENTISTNRNIMYSGSNQYFISHKVNMQPWQTTKSEVYFDFKLATIDSRWWINSRTGLELGFGSFKSAHQSFERYCSCIVNHQDGFILW